MFRPYADGEPKVWYSGVQPGLKYMRVLLTAAEVLRHVPAIEHGHLEAQYDRYLRGDFRVGAALEDAIPAELDADLAPEIIDDDGEARGDDNFDLEGALERVIDDSPDGEGLLIYINTY